MYGRKTVKNYLLDKQKIRLKETDICIHDEKCSWPPTCLMQWLLSVNTYETTTAKVYSRNASIVMVLIVCLSCQSTCLRAYTLPTCIPIATPVAKGGPPPSKCKEQDVEKCHSPDGRAAQNERSLQRSTMKRILRNLKSKIKVLEENRLTKNILPVSRP